MPIITLRDLSLSYGTHILLDGVDVNIDKGQRICIIGRNGAGKSSLLKIIASQIHHDGGELVIENGIRIATLAQEVPTGSVGSVIDVVLDGLGDAGKLIKQYEDQLNLVEEDPSEKNLNVLTQIQNEIDVLNAWDIQQRAQEVISKLQLDGTTNFEALSGGLKRRVLLAQALVSKPDVLLLDEPTNHLDIESIKWLETFLPSFTGTILFITHDRSFLKKVATHIMELDRGHISWFEGNYEKFLEFKEEALNAESQQNKLFDKRLAQEEVWIRQGIQARRTRNEGRVRALKAMREERKSRREQQGKAAITASKSERSGKIVFKVRDISFKYDDEFLYQDFSTDIIRGDKIGILGPNGCGKSTLLNAILGKLKPTKGEVIPGASVEVSYFDQLRDQLNESLSIRDNVAEGSDFIEINGNKIHVISYLQKFLFSSERMHTPVSALSGGERNRLLLAKVLSKPSNVLVLDEPTNDLDIETLEILEEMLVEYQGTILLVSHDREFIDNVVTSTIVFEGTGQLQEYIGGYEDWLRQKSVSEKKATASSLKKTSPNKTEKVEPRVGNKLSFKEKKELECLPDKIEKMESSIALLHEEMTSPDFYKLDADEIKVKQEFLAKSEQALALAYEAWDMLEAKDK
jgi:ATP-binding cassette subfamily F protein uup